MKAYGYLLTMLICVSGITGCCTKPALQPVLQNVVIQKDKVPAEYLIIPEPVPYVNLSTATQKDVAKMIVLMDARIKLLISNIEAISKFNE